MGKDAPVAVHQALPTPDGKALVTSTYATIISTIQARGYVKQEHRRFFASEIGKVVTDLLVAVPPRRHGLPRRRRKASAHSRRRPGLLLGALLAGGVAASVIGALAVLRRPRVASILTPMLLLLCAGTVVAEGLGH